MAFPNAHLLVRFNGSLGPSAATNSEKWSSSLRLAVIGADVSYSAANLLTLANSIHAATITFHGGSAAKLGNNCYFQNVSIARIGTDGRYSPAQQETVYSTGNPQAGTGIPDQPWSSASVISLRTGNFRGYASNGRFYYPQLVGNVDTSTGRVQSAVVIARVAAAKVWFDAINAAATTYALNMRIAVVSSTGSTAALVTSIRSDERLDSIERRENAGPTVWRAANLA